MLGYIVRRLGNAVILLVILSVIAFVMMRVLPGDPAIAMLAGPQGNGEIDPVQLEILREELGLNDSVVTQYLRWAGETLRGDFGESYLQNRSVTEMIRSRMPVTAELAALSLTMTVLVGVPLGVLAAVRHRTVIDQGVRVISILGLALPSFWIATLLLLGLVTWFQWAPPVFYTPFTNDPLRNLQQFILPMLAVSFSSAAVTARLTRATMLTILADDYIRTARSKGLSGRAIAFRHALPNALPPVITLLGLQLTGLLGGSVLMEKIFNLPGLGALMVDSVVRLDLPVIQVLILVVGVMVVVVNILADVLVAAVNPRVRFLA